MNVCNHCHSHFIGESCPHCQSSQSTSSKSGVVALSLLLGVGLIACEGPQALYGAPYTEQDLDGDGFLDIEDCDDQDPYTYPGVAFEDSETACMTDFDGDGYGDVAPAEYVESGTDCDDSDPTVNPGNENCD